MVRLQVEKGKKQLEGHGAGGKKPGGAKGALRRQAEPPSVYERKSFHLELGSYLIRILYFTMTGSNQPGWLNPAH